ncbi:MAG: response regulator transcription factor [Acidimicrobiales bacterium]
MTTRSVLIVDDEIHIRALLEQTLEDLEDDGITIVIAEDGAAGLEAVRTHRPELVFLDVMMPRMNGYDVCQQLKGDPDLAASTFVVMLTAKGQEVDRTRGAEVGADVYTTKPFDPDEILDLARRVLRLD